MAQLTVNIEIEFIPKAAFNTPWNHIEVKPVRVEKGNDEDTVIVCADDSVAEFWSIYLIDTKGESHCVADLPTKKLATQLAKLIKYASKSKIKK